MINKQFFDTFGIKPKKGCTAYDKFTEEEADAICNDKCAECSYLDDVYPQITDRILLELICELSDVCCPYFAFKRSISELKETVLKLCMAYKDLLKQQVRALFEEVKNAR